MNLKEKVRIVPDYPKQGIRFMDITTLFKDADAFKELVERMKRELEGIKVDAVVGPEARGFVLGATLAYSMGVGFVPARKPGKLPAEVVSRNYKFGDGEQCLQIHRDAIKPGDKVVVIDDLLATGSTALAACKLVEELGGEVVKVVFLMELAGLKGREKLAGYDVASVICYDGK